MEYDSRILRISFELIDIWSHFTAAYTRIASGYSFFDVIKIMKYI